MSTLHSLGDIVVERYRITAALGKRNKGNTYVAEDLVKNKLVAIKTISLKQMNDWKDLELLERQAKVLASIEHPSVPKYIAYFHLDTDIDRSFYLVQQLIKGESLAQLIEQGWRTDEARVQDIALQTLEILKYLHQRTPPVIHRDIEPCNLLRGADGRIFLVDFGSVKAICPSPQTYSSTFVGTYGYVSPEQFYGKACFASDLYSLGASLLFVLSGKTPDEFLQRQMKIDFRDSVQLSPRFASWLEKMLEPSLKARFRSAQEAIASLQQLRSTSSSRLKPTEAPKRAIKTSNTPKKKNQPTAEISRKSKPTGSRVTLKRTDRCLVVEVPLGGYNKSNPSLFDIFGWWHRLEIYSQRFVISKGYLGFQSTHEGNTNDIIKVELRIESGIFGETRHFLLIWEGVTAHTFLPELTSVEKEWLVDEILDFLNCLLPKERRLIKM